MTHHTDPAAAFTARLINTDHRAHVPIHPTRDAPGLLPDPRNPDGPRWATAQPEYPAWFLERART